jgi:hypothetical protein
VDDAADDFQQLQPAGRCAAGPRGREQEQELAARRLTPPVTVTSARTRRVLLQ